MDYNQLLYEFLDGTLEQQNEQQLFLALSSNEELRKELKQIVAIKSAVKSDFAAYQPSKEAESKIFTSLGFALYPSSSGAIQPKPISTGNKFLGYLSVGLLTAITTAILMMIIPKDNNKLNQQSIASRVDTVYIEKEYITEIPKNSQNVKHYPLITANNLTSLEKQIDNPLNLKHDEMNLIKIEPIPNNKVRQHFSIANSNYGLIKNEFPKPELPETAKNLGFTFKISGNTNWLNADSIIHPERYQNFNNLSVALLYNLSNEFALGLTYRRDNYFQKFRITENGKTYEITQQPNFNNLLLTFQYHPDYIIFEHFKPLTEFNIGFNEVGYVGSFMLGTEIFPYNFTSFVLGFELSNLLYNEQNKWYLSNKYGIIYGIKLKL